MRRARALTGSVLVAVALVAPAGASAAAGTGVSIVAPTLAIAQWTPATDNLVPVHGTVELNGSPVVGLRLRVGGYALTAPTDAHGRFTYLADTSRLARYAVTIDDASHARIAGVAPSASQLASLRAAHGSIDVAYPIGKVHVSKNGAGQPVVEGQVADSKGTPPPPVVLYSYELTGRVLDAQGKPVVGARVSTRTVDRDYWTVSSPTTADGSFQSLFTASSEAGGNPVPMTIRVAIGDLIYQYLPNEFAEFQRLESARVDIRLPPRGYPIALPVPRSYPGAIDEGVVVGVMDGGTVVRPVRITWLDKGAFRIVLPRSLAGHTVSLWEADLRLFSLTAGTPGGPIDLREWPRQLSPAAPQGLARVVLK